MNRPLLIGIVALMIGEMAVIWGNRRTFIIGIMIVFTGMLLWAYLLFRMKAACMVRMMLITGITVFVMICGGMRTYGQLCAYEYASDYLEHNLNDKDKVALEGEILSREIKEDSVIYVLADVRIQELCTEYYVNVCVKNEEETNLPGKRLGKIGERIHCTGSIMPAHEPVNDGEFNQKRYYESQNILCSFYLDSQDEIVYSGKSDIVKTTLCRGREFLRMQTYQIMDKKYASVVNGILLGYKGEVDRQEKELYRLAGISHILTISGLHISLIAMGAFQISRKRLGFAGSGVVAGIVMCLYIMMVGMGVSTLRASIMFVVSVIGRIKGRTYDLISAASLAAILLVLESPLVILSSTFYLSFGAVFGVSFGNMIHKELVRTNRRVLNTFTMSIGISMVTNLLLAGTSYRISTYSVIMNVIILPSVACIVISAAAAVFISVFFMWGGRCLALLPVGIFKSYEILCKTNQLLWKNQLVTGMLSLHIIFWYLIVVVLGMVIGIRMFKKWKGNCFLRFGYFMIIYAITLVVLYTGYEEHDEISMLDVGQGDCIFIETEAGEKLLIDAGSSSENQVSEYVILPFLCSHQVETLDWLFLSHADNDHINGVVALLNESINGQSLVERIVLPKLPDTMMMEFEEIIEVAEKHKIEVYEWEAGSQMMGQRVRVECISPKKEWILEDERQNHSGDRNENCLVLCAEINDTRILLTGDLGTTGEELLIHDSPERRFDILKVGHHGSKNSTGAAFLKWANPKVAMISCSYNNRYGHPNDETIERLTDRNISIFRTDLQGQITILIDGRGSFVVNTKK